jgi:hypothetical protein
MYIHLKKKILIDESAINWQRSQRNSLRKKVSINHWLETRIAKKSIEPDLQF